MAIEIAADVCPFCGKGDRLEVQQVAEYPESDAPVMELTATLFVVTRFCVVCNHCGAIGPIGETAAVAVDFWNHREYSLSK